MLKTGLIGKVESLTLSYCLGLLNAYTTGCKHAAYPLCSLLKCHRGSRRLAFDGARRLLWLIGDVMGKDKKSIYKRLKEEMFRGEFSRTEYEAFLTDVLRGYVTETKTTADGLVYETCSIAERQKAAKELATINGYRGVDADNNAEDRSRHTVSFLPAVEDESVEITGDSPVELH